MKTNRIKNSFFNAIVMIANTAIISILSLIATNLILKNYGSDFNGVVATANQLVNLLLIVEGGFTTAINVALFKPFVEDNQKVINQIMSAAKKVFSKIGIIFLIVGVIVSLVYPLVIKSDLNYLTIFLIFLMVIIGTAYNLIFVYRNQIMFQVSQKEYLYSIFAIIINLLSNLTTIILAYNKVNMLVIRLFILIYTIINGIILYILFKKIFPKIDTKEKPNYKAIKGTKDIMVQKLTSVVYLSAPMLFISTFISTKIASVYAVYNSIFNIIKNFLSSLIAAPVNGFGQMISQEANDEVYQKFCLYEYIIILISTILLSSVLIVIIPFIKLYTNAVTDVNYVNYLMAILISAIVLLEVIHIPSGNIINVSGNFKVARKIQTISSIILISLLLIGGLFFDIYGILLATLITNIILSFLEINYAHSKIFLKNLKNFLLKLLLNIGLIIILVLGFNFIPLNITTYVNFFLIGSIVLLFNLGVIIFVNYVLFKKEISDIFYLFKKFLSKSNK